MKKRKGQPADNSKDKLSGNRSYFEKSKIELDPSSGSVEKAGPILKEEKGNVVPTIR